MRFATSTWIRVPAFAAACVAACLVLPTASVRADAIQDNIEAMKGFEKSGDDGKCLGKMQELKDSGADSRVIKAVKELVGSKNDKIACGAVKWIANLKVKDVDFLKSMCEKIGDKDFYKEKDKGGNPELALAYLDAVVVYKTDKGSQSTIKGALPKFLEVVKHHMSTNAEVACRAVRAYACVHDRFVMQQLLTWGEELESRSNKTAGGGKKGASTDTKDIEAKVKKTVLEMLAEVTQKDGGADIPSWKKWWAEHEKGFTFPDPTDETAAQQGAAPAGGVAVPTGPEFKDDAYGYSMKRPEADGWTWVKADFDGPRMGLNYAAPEDPKFLVARAYVQLYNTAKNPPKDVKGFVEWVKTEVVKKQVDTGDKEPEVKTEQIGGVEWTVVTTKGDGIGVKAGWQTIERRFYIVKFDTYMLWIDAFVRSGAEQTVKDALWNACHTLTLPGGKK